MRKSGSQGALIGYIQVMKKIYNIFGQRLDNIRKLANITAREMVNDFRRVQQSAKEEKTKTKSMDEDETNAKWQKAKDYADAHVGGTPVYNRGNPWVNRSSRAVRAVHAQINADDKEIAISLHHGIYYGAYLEYAHNRKYAILEPLLRQYAPKFFEEAKKIMGGQMI